jgi:hypothetical protein
MMIGSGKGHQGDPPVHGTVARSNLQHAHAMIDGLATAPAMTRPDSYTPVLFALGLPGAHRIPSCVLQAVLNIVDHGMSVQEVVEGPRVFSWVSKPRSSADFRKACVANSPHEGTMSFRSIMSTAACAPSPSRLTER